MRRRRLTSPVSPTPWQALPLVTLLAALPHLRHPDEQTSESIAPGSHVAPARQVSSPAARRGFTLVELLIVIVVIAILAAITIIAFNGVQDRARQTKAKADIAQIVQAVIAARSATGKTMMQITGSGATGNYCWTLATGTDLATLVGRTSRCWTDYVSALQKISDASGMTLNPNQLLDPYGRPYFIDENEGENGNCYKDTVMAYSYPFVTGSSHSGFGTTGGNVPLSGNSGCAT